MKSMCGLVVLHADGTREYLRYDSYGLMKYEAYRMESEQNGMVVCWWSELGETQGYVRGQKCNDR